MRKRNRPPPDDFEIGYRRPPKAYQFQPGQSGNSQGRPKRRSLDLRSAVLRQLDQPLTYVTKDGPRKAPAAELIARKIVEESARGNRNSLKSLTDIVSKKPNDFVDPENSNQAEIEADAARFDEKMARVLDALEREAEEEISRLDRADVKKDASGEG